MKRKLSAIFAITLMILSVLIVAPLPIKAQVAALVTFRDMIFQDAANTSDITLAPGKVPWNTVLNYPENKNLMGDLYIVGLMAVNQTASYNLTSWETGFTYDPTVLKCLSVSNVTPSQSLPKTIFQIAAEDYSMPVTWEPGMIISYNGTVTTHKHSITGGYYVTVNQPVVLAYIVFLVYGYGETTVNLTNTVLKDETGTGLIIVTAPGYFRFRIHEVKLMPTVWTKPPYSIGNLTTIPINIITSEKVNYWEANVTFDPAILVPVAVTEGAFFKAAFPGYSTFTYSTGPGWVWANCSLPTCMNVSAPLGSMLMAITFLVQSYGTSLINVISFIAKDCAGSEITPAPHFDLAEGLRMTIFKFEKLVILAPLFTPDMTTFRFWTYPAHSIGETFTVALRIVDTSQKVHAWKAGFRFNPNVLQVLSVTEGDYLSSVGTTTWTPGTIDNVNGIVTSYQCNLTDPNQYATGPGTLMLITFNVTGYGKSLISFTDTDGDPCEAKLWDPTGGEITNPGGLSITLSVFEFRAPITVKIEIDGGVPVQKYRHKTSYTVGETFNVSFKIDSLEKVYAWMTGLRFDPAFLNVTNITVGPYTPTPNYVQTMIDNVNGLVSVAVTITDPSQFATGAGLLVNITFQVKAVGYSHLYLTDAAGDPCQTVVIDWLGDKCILTTLYNGRVWRIGDVNGNGGLDIGDVKSVYAVYGGGQPANPNWIPWCDVNFDGSVNISDAKVEVNIYSGVSYTLPSLPDC